MTDSARVVVIGGGIAGCSALYHLCVEGWTDAILIERDELTSGTTWHSAAQVTNFGAIQTMVGLKSHSIRLYQELANDPDYPINYHHGGGGLRLASTQDHLDGYAHFVSLAAGMGVEFEVVDAAEAARRHPLITTDNLAGALWDPLDGDIDPAQLCQALARRSRKMGARVMRNRPVAGLTQKPDHSWTVHTDEGDVACEVVVNAGGYRCNEIGAMMGVTHPVISMEHQYFLTEPIPEIEALDYRVPLLRCPTDDFYSRQEKKGLLVGFYEQGCKTWGMDGIDPYFSNSLSPNDPDRVLDVLENVFARMPCLTETGIHTIVNGPITYSPDGLPLVGRIPGKRNAYCIIGLRAGVGEGGGHGKILAETIVHGQAEWDAWALDPRRFGDHATTEFTAAKAIEEYQNEFRFHMPHEHRPAGRPARVTPLTEVLREEGAEFGVVNGWERATFFKPSPDFIEDHSFHRTRTEDVVAAEVAHVAAHVGIMEVNGFNRIEIAGEGAWDWLDSLLCNPPPKTVGKVSLNYFLTDAGTVLGEATLARLAEDRFWWGSAAAAEKHDWDWLMARKPAGVTMTRLTETHDILVVAGPKARAVLEAASPHSEWSAAAFPWLSAREVRIGHVPAIAMSVSFSGELAWELHIPVAGSLAAWRSLREAGAPHGMKPFGLYAAESMRLEKGYRHWKADLIDERDPFESGLDRFVRLEGRDFPGKAALAARKPGLRFIHLSLEADDPAQPGASIRSGGDVVGTVSSAGFGHRTDLNLAMGFVRTGANADLTVDILGVPRPAREIAQCVYDPENSRVKA